MIQAELGELSTLSIQLGSCSGDVTDLLARLSNLINQTTWQGGAADRFRSAWESEFRPALNNLSSALTDASSEVSRREAALNLAGN